MKAPGRGVLAAAHRSPGSNHLVLRESRVCFFAPYRFNAFISAAGAAVEFVAQRIFSVVVLMIGFSRPKLDCRLNAGDD